MRLRPLIQLTVLAGATVFSLPTVSLPALGAEEAKPDPVLAQMVASPARSPQFQARDAARHPLQELAFFGLAPDQTVVEISPSGGYWTEILAPYLHDRGTYYAAANPRGTDSAYANRENAAFDAKLAADPARYGKVKVTEFGRGRFDIAPAGSADLIVTFRNLHNWMAGGYADEAMAAFYQALKPGGILGIEDHRASDAQPQDPKATSGYVRQDYAIALARKAGFELVASSEINANPKDSKDWPEGVWTLPPTLALKDRDRDRYLAVGEADNFVLKFRKPLQ
ncbi:putative methyltransferase [Nitrospirillum amazonense]|uniref:Putative methyltransferase n=1 Tax=Nitrospirillum amazonense TaxID=28077 RepID=A0A560JHZ8_9PROT|nr:class I SAM-dependent methyltransferase [Nitrospirillum amazonense]TWB70821.1 putative methyltransferase [Nitrospirillum amazonense]